MQNVVTVLFLIFFEINLLLSIFVIFAVKMSVYNFNISGTIVALSISGCK